MKRFLFSLQKLIYARKIDISHCGLFDLVANHRFKIEVVDPNTLD
jgi:hypothetical protein